MTNETEKRPDSLATKRIGKAIPSEGAPPVYRISSIPTLLIFKNGKVVACHLEVTPETTLRAEMEEWSRA
jgi:hypothetical protein